MMVEVYQRDSPNKSHIVAERVDDSTIKTECGMVFEQPKGLGLSTFKFDPETPRFERTYNPPVKIARCGNCPWDDAMETQ